MEEGRVAAQSVAVASGLYSAGIWGHRGTPGVETFGQPPTCCSYPGALRFNPWLHNWIWGFQDLGSNVGTKRAFRVQSGHTSLTCYFDMDDSTEKSSLVIKEIVHNFFIFGQNSYFG